MDRPAQIHLALNIDNAGAAKSHAHTRRDAARASEGSQNAVARRMKRDERTIRDYCSGARPVPFHAVLMLPRDGLLAIIAELIDYAQSSECESPPNSATGTEDR